MREPAKTPVDIGQVAYEAYADHVSWRSVRGEPLPGYSQQAPRIRNAWRVAAEAVRGLVLPELRWPRGETSWTMTRDAWVRSATDQQIGAVIAAVAAGSRLDENEGDRTERNETILWLSTRGEQGCEWGHAGNPARDVGGWCDPVDTTDAGPDGPSLVSQAGGPEAGE